MADSLRVGVSGAPPFVMPKGESVQGISIQIWEEVAERLNQPYELIFQPNTEANLSALENGDLDLAVGPISITPDRLANPRIDFTQPYFHGREGLMIPVKPPGLWARFKPFFGWAALSSLGGLMILLFLLHVIQRDLDQWLWVGKKTVIHKLSPQNHQHYLLLVLS